MEDFLDACQKNLSPDILRRIARLCDKKCAFPDLVKVEPHTERYIKYAPLTLWIPDESIVIFGETMAYPFRYDNKDYVVCVLEKFDLTGNSVKTAEIRSADEKGVYGIGKTLLQVNHQHGRLWYTSDEIHSRLLSAVAIVMRRNGIDINSQTMVTVYGYNKRFTARAPLCDHIKGNVRLDEKVISVDKKRFCSIM
jgi:hypothetical protein